MKKNKNEKFRNGAVTLASAAVFAASGVAMWFTGQSSSYTPMIMFSLVTLCFTVLLLINTFIPLLFSVCENGAKGEKTKKFFKAVLGFFPRYGNFISLVLNVAVCAVYIYLFYLYAVYVEPSVSVSYMHVFVVGMVFIAMLVGGKIIKHFVKDKEVRVSLSSIFASFRLNALVLVAGVALTVTGIFDTFKVMKWFEIIIGIYSMLFILVSFIGEFIRRELRYHAHIVIPLPFSAEKSDENLVEYLESNTGITLRSLFSIKYAKTILPAALFVCVVFFWLCTGIVTIEPQQQGVLYRFGKFEEILEPGFHLTMPYPLDKVDLYDTGKIRETVVGYDSDKKGNILWTESHGGTEYKLLLGDGNELVSVNIRVQYKIDDLYEYVTASSEAEKILNAQAYSVVTDLTIGTTLDAIITEDRNELSVTIETRLREYLEGRKIGIEVADVIIESIHPPVEVADIYQRAMSAEVEAQAEKDRVEGLAASTISYAEMSRNASVKLAEAEQYEKIAAARADVSEFLAMVEASDAYPDAYRYHKYLTTLQKVFSNQRLYILGEDIDEKYIYFGADVVIYN